MPPASCNATSTATALQASSMVTCSSRSWHSHLVGWQRQPAQGGRLCTSQQVSGHQLEESSAFTPLEQEVGS